ncbi:hypothetical protein ACFX5E_00195 [Flavobacterium sp. LS2P90]|uniref:HNH nuclease domain-containing protein n=1 Tax=Flavobacterium xylosi TaxID=3230415 RepID=A0ABW6HR84_9FLAO
MKETIKDYLFLYINKNDGIVDFNEISKLIFEKFPESAWKKTHWAWYKTQITSPNGKYYQLFSNSTRDNLSSRRSLIQYTDNKISINKTINNKNIYEFPDHSTSVEKTIAIELGKVCHHIHPAIIDKIVQSNIDFKNEFKDACGNLDINSFFYEGSDCLFPGVRRNINKEKIGKWKNNINQADYTILNDNTFPRHIWAFLSMNKPYEGNMWSKSGLAKFELAHVFGHKKDEKKLEKKVFDEFDENKMPYAFFTSASNVVLIPNGLMKPTDKFESIKISFYKRHIDLYGNNFYAEKNFNENFVPEWYNEINWLEPILPENWERKIHNLLEYRKKVLINKYQK